MEPDVGQAVLLEVRGVRHLVDEVVEPVELLHAAPFGGQNGGSDLGRDPEIQHGPRRLAQELLATLGQGRALRDEVVQTRT